ncbi:MFS transporter [Desulfitobacterium sp. AusDCA]|uniref:MFS transporter n=1 Tax=Desulfitobacterium sp. AusDCA TaxID=3240383 RepID=UPI003DA7464A
MSGHVSVSERLERLPISRCHIIICSMLFISWFSEALDLGGMSYLIPIIMKSFNLTTAEGGYLSSIGFLGMFFGSLVSGTLSDILGRKKMIIVSMLIWGTAGFLLSQQSTVIGLYITRFILGIGLGSQIPVAMAYLSEIIPSGYRGKFLTFYQMLVPLGIAFAGLLTVIVLPLYGWRGCFIAESIPALSFLLVWKACPESALWLESKGRLEEADKVVSLWEQHVEKETGKPLLPLETMQNTPIKQTGKITELLSSKYWKILFMCMIWYTCAMMSDYGLATWLSALLMSKGFSVINSTGFISLAVLGGVPAFFLVSWGVEKLGRKLTVLLSACLTAVFALLYGFSSSILMVIVMGAFYQFGKYSLAMANNVYTPELFETHLRATGVGFGLACGRFGSMLGPIFLAWVMSNLGSTATFLAAAGLAVISGVAVYILGPETKGKVFKLNLVSEKNF